MSIDKKKLKLPDKPGVYIFLGEKKEILYIGKATSLRTRVQSYFRDDVIATRGPLIVDLMFKAKKVDYEETDSVLEALILEAALIKKYQPKYNTKEKDNKSFNFVCITKEKPPRVITKRGREIINEAVSNFSPLRPSPIKGSERDPQGRKIQNSSVYKTVFGPFTSGAQLREAMKIIRPIFPFLDEKSKNHYKFYKQVALVPDIESKEGLKKYKNNLKHLKLFFEGKKKRVLKDLEKEMKEHAKEKEFEEAGEVKRQIFALKHINDVALLKDDIFSAKSHQLKAGFRVEAYDIAHMGGKNMVGVMTVVVDGEAEKSEYKKFKIRSQSGANDTGALNEVLERRLGHPEWGMPDLIVVDGGVAQLNVAKKVLTSKSLPIKLVSVVKDERHKPKDILGDKVAARKYEKEILLANSESHRFAINYHKNMRGKSFLNKAKPRNKFL